MGKKTETETIRVRRITKMAICRAAYGPPFHCASIAEFLRLIETGNLEAIAAWQRAAKGE